MSNRDLQRDRGHWKLEIRKRWIYETVGDFYLNIFRNQMAFFWTWENSVTYKKITIIFHQIMKIIKSDVKFTKSNFDINITAFFYKNRKKLWVFYITNLRWTFHRPSKQRKYFLLCMDWKCAPQMIEWNVRLLEQNRSKPNFYCLSGVRCTRTRTLRSSVCFDTKAFEGAKKI